MSAERSGKDRVDLGHTKLRDDLATAVHALVNGEDEIELLDEPPARTALPFGRTIAHLDAITLAVDVRQYCTITAELGPDTALQMIKAFFVGAIDLVERRTGSVIDFNGDGMIVLFSGSDRMRRAFLASAEIRWFVNHVLRSAFAPHFARVGGHPGGIDQFDVGCGLAEGMLSIGRIGTDFASDIVCVGEGVHAASRLCKLARSPQGLAVTDVVRRGADDLQLHPPIRWESAGSTDVGGVARTSFTTGFEWPC